MVIRPLDHVKEGKVIFLAGPIQSAPEWHLDAIKLLKDNDIVIACPKVSTYPVDWSWDKQYDWETKYLKMASENGVILFNLTNAIENNPNRSYAQTTRFELAEWYSKKLHNSNINIVVAIEEGFHGSRYIKKKCEDFIPVFNSLEEACTYIKKIITND